MRHDSIETTLRYYVDLDADEMAEEFWKTIQGNINTFINTPSSRFVLRLLWPLRPKLAWLYVPEAVSPQRAGRNVLTGMS
jgi:hypothetical protein